MYVVLKALRASQHKNIYCGVLRVRKTRYYFKNYSTYVRCLVKRSLNELHQILGNGIGIGLSGRRPTKSCPLKYCTLNGKLNSVEVDDSITPAIQANLLMTTKNNGIDFLYSNEMRQLSSYVRFTSMTVTNPEVAISRIRTADVKWPATSTFIGAWFVSDNVVYEVVRISGNLALCKDPNDEETDAVLHQIRISI
jgi:hypothetical protein